MGSTEPVERKDPLRRAPAVTFAPSTKSGDGEFLIDGPEREGGPPAPWGPGPPVPPPPARWRGDPGAAADASGWSGGPMFRQASLESQSSITQGRLHSEGGLDDVMSKRMSGALSTTQSTVTLGSNPHGYPAPPAPPPRDLQRAVSVESRVSSGRQAPSPALAARPRSFNHQQTPTTLGLGVPAAPPAPPPPPPPPPPRQLKRMSSGMDVLLPPPPPPPPPRQAPAPPARQPSPPPRRPATATGDTAVDRPDPSTTRDPSTRDTTTRDPSLGLSWPSAVAAQRLASVATAPLPSPASLGTSRSPREGAAVWTSGAPRQGDLHNASGILAAPAGGRPLPGFPRHDAALRSSSAAETVHLTSDSQEGADDDIARNLPSLFPEDILQELQNVLQPALWGNSAHAPVSPTMVSPTRDPDPYQQWAPAPEGPRVPAGPPSGLSRDAAAALRALGVTEEQAMTLLRTMGFSDVDADLLHRLAGHQSTGAARGLPGPGNVPPPGAARAGAVESGAAMGARLSLAQLQQAAAAHVLGQGPPPPGLVHPGPFRATPFGIPGSPRLPMQAAPAMGPHDAAARLAGFPAMPPHTGPGMDPSGVALPGLHARYAPPLLPQPTSPDSDWRVRAGAVLLPMVSAYLGGVPERVVRVTAMLLELDAAHVVALLRDGPSLAQAIQAALVVLDAPTCASHHPWGLDP